jgi:phage/conjugal plasmid C-4 type zinc finger TraR family protein
MSVSIEITRAKTQMSDRARRMHMATGWARDGAVQDQIDDTIKDAVDAVRVRLIAGAGATHCDDCGEPIPEARRAALPSVRRCVACQSAQE